MAEAAQSMTRQSFAGGDGGPKQGRLGALLSEYLGDRALRQVGLIVGLAAAIAAGIALFSWAQQPAYRALFANLPMEDASAVMDALTAANVPYRTDPTTGDILVPAGSLHDARLTLASQGLPNTGGVGFESLRQEQSFGTSRFMETARFHRALETELARTIGSLRAVQNARVHLAIPEQSAFMRDQRSPRASVTVGLYPGRTLTGGQVAAITNMVSSAVPELALENVTVVDQGGQLLTGDGDGESGADVSGEQLAYKQRIESAYAERIRTLLAPMVGEDSVRAEVNARIDYSAAERTEEIYDPEATALRSEQASEQVSRDGDGAMGVPGALVNQPPGEGELEDPAAGAEEGAAEGQAGGEAPPTNRQTNTTRNFEVSKTIRHVQTPRGRVERLSIAVLVDQPPPAAEGEPGGYTNEQLQQMQSLVRQAVGFDEARGDTVDVVSTPFQAAPEAPAPEPPPVWEQPWVWEVGKLLLAAILGLVLILTVVRPLVRGLLGRDLPRSGGGSGGGEGQTALTDEDGVPQLTGPDQQAALAEQARAQLPSGQGGLNYEEHLSTAREAVGQDPTLAANVVKGWLAQES